MPCYWPLKTYEGPVKEEGKVNVVWRRRDSERGVELYLPCGQCVGCRLERSRQWAVRCLYEASLYERNCFVTLTYDEAHLPKSGSLDVREFQLFMKRLRKDFDGVRFFHCGEYGTACETCGLSRFGCVCAVFKAGLGRPHYHALLFNCDFDDKVLFTERNGHGIYTSVRLGEVWQRGYASIGEVSFESAGYVARYSMKKLTGEKAVDHYVNKRSGEVLRPEYVTMSRRPGIGRGWFDKFKGDVFPSDFLVVNGVKMKPPRFFDNLLDKSELELVKSRRKLLGNRMFPTRIGDRVVLVSENDSFRLPVREQVKLAQIGSLKRSLEV